MAHLVKPLLLLALWLLAPSTAAADDSPGQVERPGYGWAMTGAYLAAPLLAIGGAQLDPTLGIGLFVLTPPAVHLAYGDSSWAVLSLIGPSASIAAGYFLMRLAQGECHENFTTIGRCFTKPLVGAMVGYVAWATIDIVVSHHRAGVAVLPRDDGALLVAYGAF